ncbi:alpha/beta fold hydrolase [Pseudonocardia adelaidensis]|uniref:AB hydrolase-1 domain-containing protein n=1 Tax=Pseudonocardia adelaidensis TaxID=648754 RepID=A0ABP9NSI7_9PSEU
MSELASGSRVQRPEFAGSWAVVRGRRVHARVGGRVDAPVVVLLHGLGVSSRYMLPLARELAPDFRVHALDLPGFGRSEPAPAVLDVPGLADALLAWVDEAGLDAPALVANSIGCQVVASAMARSPEALGRAVLVGPTFDRHGRGIPRQVARLLRSGVHERPGLVAVMARDYAACGLRRVARTARHGLAHRIEDDLPAIARPVLVVRGGRDRVVPQRWAEEVTAALPDGRLAVVPGHGHALNYSAPGPLAAAIRPFLGGPPPGPDAPTARPATASIAQFDSATTFLKGTAATLHGRDLPALGAFPRPVAPLVERVVPAVNLLPERLREQVYRIGSGSEAAPPGELHAVSAEALARWMVAQYPRREFPAAIVGSSSGALAHLAAALGVPYLPQTFLLPVAQPQVHPDDPRHGLAAGRGPGRMLLDANPDVALHHMHDPNQDRLSLARMTYFRLKRRRLGPAFTGFLAETLPRGATLLVADCRLRWPVTRVGDRHVFQFGALGGMPAEEFRTGGVRVADYLRRYGSDRAGWDPPPVDGDAPEAEWGFDPALWDDLRATAEERGWRLRRVTFDAPAALSPLVADLYRWWYRRRDRPADRLLVESFVLIEPRLVLETGVVPYWSEFPVEPSAAALERYLDGVEPFEEILVTLFQHGTDGVGVAPAGRWRELSAMARRRGAFLGVDPRRHPRDFGSFGRFHRQLAGMPRAAPPAPLTLEELDLFLAGRRDESVDWS